MGETGTTTNGQGLAGTGNPVTEDALDKRITDLKTTIERFSKPLWAIFIGIIIVLFLGLVATITAMQALVVESNNFKTSSYENLNNKVDSLLQKNTYNKKPIPFNY